jgi:hypothetical protein
LDIFGLFETAYGQIWNFKFFGPGNNQPLVSKHLHETMLLLPFTSNYVILFFDNYFLSFSSRQQSNRTKEKDVKD